MKKSMILMSLALAAPLAMAQTQAKPAATPAAPQTAKGNPSADTDPVIMTAGTLSIRKAEFEQAIKTLPQEYQQFAMGAGKKQFAEDYLRMKLLATQGLAAGLDKDPSIQAQLALMRENLVATEQLHRVEQGISIPDAELKKAYEDHKKDYEQVKARHILIATKGSPAAKPDNDLTDEQAKVKAESLRKQIVEGKAKFEDLAKKESDDSGSAEHGGDIGAFSHGQMVPEFEQAAFAAKVNEVTPVVKTQFGYHVIEVTGHDYVPYEQVKPALEKKAREAKLHEKLDEIKNAAKPTFNEAYFPAPPAAAAPKKQ